MSNLNPVVRSLGQASEKLKLAELEEAWQVERTGVGRRRRGWTWRLEDPAGGSAAGVEGTRDNMEEMSPDRGDG